MEQKRRRGRSEERKAIFDEFFAPLVCQVEFEWSNSGFPFRETQNPHSGRRVGHSRNERKEKAHLRRFREGGPPNFKNGRKRFRVRYELTLLFHGNVGHGGAMQLVAHSDRQGFAIGTCSDARDADHLSITFVGFFDGVLA